MFWGGQIETRYKKSPPTTQLFGETAGSFPAHDWTLKEGRLLLEEDVITAATCACLAMVWQPTFFPLAPP